LERINTTIFNENALEHLHRYALVRDLVKGKVVLDIASGEGYGSNLLAKTASEVFGVDICEETINNAKGRYIAGNLKFVQGDITCIPFQADTFDVIICFETIEHVSNQHVVIRELKRVLKNDGVLIISTPEKKKYSDDKNFKNPYHVKEFYEQEFKDFIKKHFKNANFLHQYMSYGSCIHYENKVEVNEIISGNYSLVQKKNTSNPLYILSICSEVDCPRLDSGIFNYDQINSDILMLLAMKNMEEEYILLKKNSRTYKFINMLTSIKALLFGLGNRTKL